MGDDVKFVITEDKWDDTFDTVSPLNLAYCLIFCCWFFFVIIFGQCLSYCFILTTTAAYISSESNTVYY